MSNAESAPQILPPIDPNALYSRVRASPYLGDASSATMVRMERRGRLLPIKRDPHSPKSVTFYRGANLIAVRDGRDYTP